MTKHLAGLYTPVEDAVAELQARRAECADEASDELEKKLLQQPCAFLPPNIATPNFELSRFISLAASAGLRPIVGEFQRDKFVHRSPDKYALARMTFHGGTGRNGGSRNCCVSVADMTRANGLPMQQVVTHKGQSLIEFHHHLLSASSHLPAIELHDTSDWFYAHGSTAREYYTDFLSLFVRHAILFENFLLTPHEKPFTNEIVLPAFEAAHARNGLRPLICRLDPPDAEGDPYWLQYPMELLPVARGLLE